MFREKSKKFKSILSFIFASLIIVQTGSAALAWDPPPGISREESASAFNAVGIQNMGASCYLNACIQQLYRSPIKGRLLLIPDANRSTQPVTYAMQNIFIAMDAQGSGPINVEHYVEVLVEAGLYNGEQKDASEIFDTIINKLEDEIIHKLRDDAVYRDGIERALGIRIRSESELSQIKPMLNIGLTTTTGYRGPSPVSKTRVVETSLSLPLHPSLDAAIAGYSADSPFEGGRYGGGIRRTRITSTSEMLKITLGRFEYRDGALVKLNGRMEFPQFLEIQSTGKYYEVTGIIRHDGDANNGHYISYVKSPHSEDWYEINDETVTKMPNFESVTGTCYGGDSSEASAYVLFYSQLHY